MTDTIANRRLLPPTKLQIERIMELKARPEFASGENLEWLHDALMKRKMLRNQAQAGIVVSLMKQRILQAGGTVD